MGASSFELVRGGEEAELNTEVRVYLTEKI